MKRVTLWQMCVVAGSLSGALLVVGCASDKPAAAKPAAPVAAAPAPQPVSLTQMKSDLMAFQAQVDSTNTALNSLAKSSSADAQTNYNKFAQEYVKLQGKGDTVRASADALRTKASDYYARWTKQMQVENPELRRQAVMQKANAEQIHSTVNSEVELAKIAVKPYMASLKDVGDYLNGNVSPASLASVTDLVAKSDAQAKQLQGHVNSLVESIDKIAAATGEGAGAVPAAATAPAAAAQ